MSFDGTFSAWLDGALTIALPREIKAFSFNLTNVYDNEYAVELIGASRFDPADPDWACDEIWHATPREIDIPLGALGTEWEDVLKAVNGLVLRYLDSGSKKDVLKSAQGVGVGFVDGDLKVLWRK